VWAWARKDWLVGKCSAWSDLVHTIEAGGGVPFLRGVDCSEGPSIIVIEEWGLLGCYAVWLL
jgi:hypothetical protein